MAALRMSDIGMKTDTRAPDLSVVVPFFNRAATIQYTLESVARARQGMRVETILVDDGSTPPAAEQLAGELHQPDRLIRQENQGLLFARLNGLAAACGEYVLFLDSDDLVGPEKFAAQLAAMRVHGADVSYTDCARAELHKPYDAIVPHSPDHAEETDDSAIFFVRVQPAPHSPVFRTDWLRQLVGAPLFPPSRLYNPVAEIWFYHIAAPVPAMVVKVPGAHTIGGQHGGARLTNNWERLGVASLAVMEAFQRNCPKTAATKHARQLVGERAFCSWRALPYDFFPEFGHRLLAIWRHSPHGCLAALGGRKFQALARLLGPVLAGRVLRRLGGRPYQTSRTLKDTAVFVNWMAQLPAPKASLSASHL
ncbi:MAG: hypothetical protein DMG36_15970 [Acidobacteria bacterium]|nr:MAG: hypothetical protein DMG36_15970 [Acidobacteriota bacterium]